MNYPWALTFLAAELSFLLAQKVDLQVLAKREDQRTSDESARVRRGLARRVLIEGLLLVPASAWLLLLVIPDPWFQSIPTVAGQEPKPLHYVYGIVGVVSYGLPYATFKRISKRLAFKALLEFKEILTEESAEELKLQQPDETTRGTEPKLTDVPASSADASLVPSQPAQPEKINE